MSAFADLNELVNRATGGNSGTPELLFMHKEWRVAGAGAVATVAGKPTSLWQYEGNPSHGAVPTTVAVPDNTTAGAWKQSSPGGGRQKWNPSVFGVASQAGTLFLYDRLLHIGGLDATVATAQTVGGALTRNTGGVGNQIFAEIYTQIGATGTTIVPNYTNQAGAAKTGQVVPFGNTNIREVGRLVPLSLAAGDNGVQGVTSVTLAATTGTAGNFGITVARPLCAISIATVSAGSVKSFVDGPLNEIVAGACLAWYWLPTTIVGPTIDMWMFNLER